MKSTQRSNPHWCGIQKIEAEPNPKRHCPAQTATPLSPEWSLFKAPVCGTRGLFLHSGKAKRKNRLSAMREALILGVAIFLLAIITAAVLVHLIVP
jgi:hypothetical protein